MYSRIIHYGNNQINSLNSIKEESGKLPILICISQKKDRSYIKTEILIDNIAEFDSGKVIYRKDAGIINRRLLFVLSQYKEKFDSLDSIDILTAAQIKSIITAKERPIHILFLEYWKKRILDFRKDDRESYVKMNEDTIKMFLKAEGDLPIPALNYRTVEHFYKWMIKNEYAIGGISLRLSHLKARINELIRNGILKQIFIHSHTLKYLLQKLKNLGLPLPLQGNCVFRYRSAASSRKRLIT